jgi:hypothetical protein
MKISVDVRGFDAVQKKLAGLQAGIKDQVLAAAINKTAAKAQTEVNRAIREEYLVKADEVRNSMSLRKANKGNIEAVIDIFGSKKKRGRSANMIHFLAALQSAGVAVKTRGAVGVKKKDLAAIGRQLGFQIKRGSGIKQIRGAFIANRGRTVFIREGKERLPIKPVQVIGFSQMFSSKKISKRVMDKVDRDLVVEVERAIKLVMERNR